MTLLTREFRPTELSTDSGSPKLPAILEPQGANDFVTLLRFAERERDAIEKELRTTGGVLLRGWEVRSADEFERLLQVLGLPLEEDYLLGTTPRSNVGSHVFTSTEAPATYPIFAHNEMSYLNTRPMRIAFYCEVEPRRYGETPIFDTRAAFQNLDPEVARRLSERKVRYVRKLPFERRAWQDSIHRTWPETFLTTDRDEVARIAADHAVECTWVGNDLQTEVVVDPIIQHPETGETSLNIQLYHETNMLLDIENLASRQSWMTNYTTRLKARLGFRFGWFPIEVRFGDGEPIPPQDVRAIRQATWDTAVLFHWRKSDVLLLENLITGHGRMNVEAPRKIVAAFGRMWSFHPPTI